MLIRVLLIRPRPTLPATIAGIPAPQALSRVVSIYGTTDAGVLGVETPLSATLRHWLSSRPDVMRQLFTGDRIPSLFQYDPLHRFFETNPADGTLALTTMPAVARRPLNSNSNLNSNAGSNPNSNSGSKPEGSADEGEPGEREVEEGCRRLALPSLRYAIGDVGGTMSFDAFLSYLRSKGFDADPAVLPPHRRLPFVWVFGRAHWTVSLYGANVFVENGEGVVSQRLGAHWVERSLKKGPPCL